MNQIQSTCPICNSTKIMFISKYRSNNNNFIGVNLVRCNDCNLVFASPKLDDEFIEKYNSEYFKSAHGGLANDNLTLSFFSAIAKLRYSYIQNFLDKNITEFKIFDAELVSLFKSFATAWEFAVFEGAARRSAISPSKSSRVENERYTEAKRK